MRIGLRILQDLCTMVYLNVIRVTSPFVAVSPTA